MPEAVSKDREVIQKAKADMAFVGKGEALRNLGKYEDALVSYNKTLQHNPQPSQRIVVWVGKGHILYAQNHREEALQAYNYAIQYGTKDAHCYSNVGKYLLAGVTTKQPSRGMSRLLPVTQTSFPRYWDLEISRRY